MTTYPRIALFALAVLAGPSAAAADELSETLHGCIQRNWAPPPGGMSTTVTLRVRLKPDGEVEGRPRIVKSHGGPNARAIDEGATRALLRCLDGKPFRTFLYERWEELVVNFGPPADRRD